MRTLAWFALVACLATACGDDGGGDDSPFGPSENPKLTGLQISYIYVDGSSLRITKSGTGTARIFLGETFYATADGITTTSLTDATASSQWNYSGNAISATGPSRVTLANLVPVSRITMRGERVGQSIVRATKDGFSAQLVVDVIDCSRGCNLER